MPIDFSRYLISKLNNPYQRFAQAEGGINPDPELWRLLEQIPENLRREFEQRGEYNPEERVTEFAPWAESVGERGGFLPPRFNLPGLDLNTAIENRLAQYQGGQPTEEPPAQLGIPEMLRQIFEDPYMRELLSTKVSPEKEGMLTELQQIGKPDLNKQLWGIFLSSLASGLIEPEQQGFNVAEAQEAYQKGLEARSKPELAAWQARWGQMEKPEELRKAFLTTIGKGLIERQFAPEEFKEHGYGQMRSTKTGKVISVPTKPEASKGKEAIFGQISPKDYTPESIKKFNETGDYSILVPREVKEGAELKIGSTKEKILAKMAEGKSLTEGEEKAWNALSKSEQIIGREVVRLLLQNFRFIAESDPVKRQEMIRETEEMVKDIYGTSESSAEEHPLSETYPSGQSPLPVPKQKPPDPLGIR